MGADLTGVPRPVGRSRRGEQRGVTNAVSIG